MPSAYVTRTYTHTHTRTQALRSAECSARTHAGCGAERLPHVASTQQPGRVEAVRLALGACLGSLTAGSLVGEGGKRRRSEQGHSDMALPKSCYTRKMPRYFARLARQQEHVVFCVPAFGHLTSVCLETALDGSDVSGAPRCHSSGGEAWLRCKVTSLGICGGPSVYGPDTSRLNHPGLDGPLTPCT
jgi:hypothetical protein